MHVSFEDQIRERAYQIWLAGGMTEGMAHEHWVSAERAVQAETAPKAMEAQSSNARSNPAQTVAAKTPKAKHASTKVATASRAKNSKPVSAMATH